MLELHEHIGITASTYKPAALKADRCGPIDSGAPSGSLCPHSKLGREFRDQNARAKKKTIFLQPATLRSIIFPTCAGFDSFEITRGRQSDKHKKEEGVSSRKMKSTSGTQITATLWFRLRNHMTLPSIPSNETLSFLFHLYERASPTSSWEICLPFEYREICDFNECMQNRFVLIHCSI